ncbi:hypothetical protein Cpir12675_001539 [Ceratocystis pirilliformis]|uniref:Proteasome maturation factor UMP1 n=1 Tax=Ceratocystis pirilliformis TaxID=259994 RepID=A0ABR3ZEY7_9PEZI
MAMRIVPEASTKGTFTHTQKSLSAPSAPGVHDVFRSGLGPSAANSTTASLDSSAPTSGHPLEARLKQWEETRENLRLQTLRRVYGIAEPVRQGMELKIVRDSSWRPAVLGGGLRSVHEDILRGKDSEVTWEDIYTGDETVGVAGFHAEIEHKLKMQ